MSKGFKSFISIVLCLIMMLGTVTVWGGSFAEILKTIGFKAYATDVSGTCGDNLTWEFDDSTGTLTINGTGEMYAFVHISDETSAPWKSHYSDVKTIVFGEGVTSIGDWAFFRFTQITSITIPDNITIIGEGAFFDCMGLKSLTIPGNVTSIGESAFAGCLGLESITVNASNTVYHSANNCLVETKSKTLVAGCKNSVIPNDGSITVIGKHAFFWCSGLTSVTIPNSITSINDWAFARCTGLTVITLPNSVISIGDWAFEECTGLTSITIPDSVTIIGNEAFQSCSKLTSITIPDSVTSIGEQTFYDCSGLTSVTIPNSVVNIGDHAFYGCSGLTNITIPNSIKIIDEGAFSHCTGLKSIIIPNSVTSIGYDAFWCCSGVESIKVEANNPVYHSSDNCLIETESKTLIVGCKNSVIPKDGSVAKIGDDAFSYCTGLASITIPDSVKSIGYSAFSHCTGLTSITIPYDVTSIRQNTFYKCTGLESVNIPNSITKIEQSAFEKCTGLTNIIIPDNVTIIGRNAFEECTKLESITIPDSVTSIGKEAFRGCTSLTDVTIGNGVSSIEENLFYGCTELMSVTIGNSVTGIAKYAFCDCNALSVIIIPDSVTNIGKYAFSRCTGLTYVTIGNNVTKIDDYAFHKCTNLTSIIIPSSVTSMGNNVFFDCPSDLIIFGYAGTLAQNYAEEYGIIFVTIDNAPYVTIHLHPVVDTPNFKAYGVANYNETVYVYDGNVFLGTVSVDSSGRWSGAFTLESPDDPSSHTITAKVTVGDDTATASTRITYDSNCVFPVEFLLTHNSRIYDLLFVRHINISFVPSLPLEFKVKLNKNDNVESLRIVSIKSGEKKYIKAEYNSSSGYWEANGWFDPENKNYKPGELTIEINGEEFDVETAKITFLIDPSGYVYEAVKSNRVKDASAMIYYKDGEVAIPWNANRYEQDNPQTTDEFGIYHWDVLEGSWRVKVIKNGYEVSYSDWMDVPPEWKEVAIPLVTKEAPRVEKVEGENSLLVTFSQYMDIDSVNASNITLKNGGKVIDVTITSVNKEVSGTDEKIYYASEFKIEPKANLSGKSELKIKNVKNYAGIAIEKEYTCMVDTPDAPISEFTAKFISDGKTVSEKKYKEGDEIVKPANPSKEGFTFKEWNPAVPDKMPAKDMTFTAVFEKNADNSDAIPDIAIKGYKKELKADYKSKLIFHADVKNADGCEIVWLVNGSPTGQKGDTFTIEKATEKEYKISASLVKDGKTVKTSDAETVTVNTGFFAKIIAFFKGLFNALPVYEDNLKK